MQIMIILDQKGIQNYEYDSDYWWLIPQKDGLLNKLLDSNDLSESVIDKICELLKVSYLSENQSVHSPFTVQHMSLNKYYISPNQFKAIV